MRDEALKRILKETFGYEAFRFDQLKIINSILDGKDTLAIMPTGGGKSLCYQIPALYLTGVTLVISPLISLMQDQVMNLGQSGVNAVFLNSSLSQSDLRASKNLISKGRAKIVYVSPEGLLSGILLEFFKDLEVSLIAVDEAHCVSQWGHEFRKDYIRLGELKQHFPRAAYVALTATADAKTRQDIILKLGFQDPSIFVSSFDRPNIKYAILERRDELRQLDGFIKGSHSGDTGIVYCLSRDKVERVAKELRALGYPAVAYHVGLSKEERARSQERFNTEDTIIVVATIAFSMGIDRPDVRFVAHLDLPKSVESYYQETGRAGRDGKPSTAWMIYGIQDVVKLSQMIETTDAPEDYKKVARHKLDSMLALCETATCRRAFLLQYFGEGASESCAFCDTCLEPPVLWDAMVDAQKVLSTIYRTKETFGAGHVIDVLRGSKSIKVLSRNHDQLTVFGIGKDQSKEHWNLVLRQLLNLHYVAIKSWEYKSLALTSKSGDILKGLEKLHLRRQEAPLAPKIQKAKKDSSRAKDATHDRADLFTALKTLRSRLAKEKGLPPYIIFSDRSLHDMCELLPRTESEFLLVHGVGQAKLEAYGTEFLKEIASASY